jgi:ADP-ribose pyrophosphatase YjhB (NUDIX family)
MPDYLRWLRSRIGSRKVILAFATALIFDDDGRLLFQKRTDFREAWWGLPGGVLEIGESFEQCAVRESLEETGLRVEPTRLVGVYSSPDFDVRYPNGDEVQQFTVAIECRVTGGDSRPDGVEVAEHHFFSADEWRKLTLPPWYAAMARDFASGKPPQFDPPLFKPDPSTLPAVAGQAPADGWRELRAQIGSGRMIAPGAGAFIQNESGQVLLGLRHEGLWGIPAGLMELGETISGTLVREAREEMNVDIAPRELLGVFTGPDFFHTYADGNQVQIASTLFRADIVGGELRPDGVETLDLRWFDPANLPEMPARHKRLVKFALSR